MQSDQITALLRQTRHRVEVALTVSASGLLGFVATLVAAMLVGFLMDSTSAVDLQQRVSSYVRSEVSNQQSAQVDVAANTGISHAFSMEVLYWEPLILAWGQIYGIDPNLIATLIQIESCGDPTVASPAGAQGLFQVMPLHFAPEEDMLDVQTNAARGLDYFTKGLVVSGGDAGLALAGYNGGHGIIGKEQAFWSAETQRYYYWGVGIYREISAGAIESPTLAEWMNAGGSRLCNRASQSIAILEHQARAIASAPQ